MTVCMEIHIFLGIVRIPKYMYFIDFATCMVKLSACMYEYHICVVECMSELMFRIDFWVSKGVGVCVCLIFALQYCGMGAIQG